MSDAGLFHSACFLVFLFPSYFQRGQHHLQLAYIQRIETRYQTVNLTAGRHNACRSGCFLTQLFERGQLHERKRRLQQKSVRLRAKVSLTCSPGFHRPGALGLAVQVGNRVEQGTLLQRQMVFWKFIMLDGILTKCQLSLVVDSYLQLRRGKGSDLA